MKKLLRFPKFKKVIPRREGYMTARVVGQPSSYVITRNPAEMKFYKKHKIKIKKRYRVATLLSYVVEVPILLTTVPEVPDAVYIGKNVFVKTCSAPLTYQWVSIWKARKRKTEAK